MEEIDPEDDLKAENALLKLKLEMEHGMPPSDFSNLSPDMENQWLRYIYDFERLSKETPRVKVFDLLGKPTVTPLGQLAPDQVLPALEALEDLMLQKGIALDCCCDYDAAVIYKFITEELFQHETQHVGMEGMVTHFTYEEFHPNHDYDIQHRVKDFIEALLRGRWEHQFDGIWLASPVSFKGSPYTPQEISNMIAVFQEVNGACQLHSLEIETVNFDLEAGSGTATGSIEYTTPQTENKVQGSIRFDLVLVDGWEISSINMPGFGDV
jgi:hypothetical protein